MAIVGIIERAKAFFWLKLLGLGVVFATGWDPLGWCLFLAGGLCVVAHHLLPRSQGLCDVVTGIRVNLSLHLPETKC